jgi:dynein heavy chain 2
VIAEALLGDLGGFEKFSRDAKDLKDELQNFRRDQFDEWAREIQSLIDDHKQPLRSVTQLSVAKLQLGQGCG